MKMITYMNKKILYENLNKLNDEFIIDFLYDVENFLKTGWYILGDSVKLFEENFAKYNNANYCIGVANGLDALELGLKVFDFPVESEIIVPSNTYIASILAIVNVGHIPILVEPNINTYNIDTDLIEAKITNKTKAILVVHLYGNIAQMDKISALAYKYNLEIIEDCAQSHGGEFNNIKTGNFGKIGAFSFYPTKNLGSIGDAGAIITNDIDIYNKLKALRNYGSHIKYNNKYIGRNSRLDEIQAIFLNIKLKKLDIINIHKRSLAEIYTNKLTNKVIKPIEISNSKSVYHIYNIRTEYRDELKDYLNIFNIKTEIHYPIPPHKQEAFINFFSNEHFELSDIIHKTTLSLPISYTTSIEDVEYICYIINNFFENK